MTLCMHWQPFTAAELPPRFEGELDAILRPLYIATLELYRTVYRYELLAALGRNVAFVDKINGTTAAPALNTVKGCVFTAIIVSLCAFFDEGRDSVNLRMIVNRVLKPDYVESFRDFHNARSPTFDTDKQRARLLRLQRRLKKGNVAKSIVRLSDLRNQVVAHLDTRPKFEDRWPVNRDMVIVLATVANIVTSLVRFLFAGRRITPSLIREDAQRQARTLCQAIHPPGGAITIAPET